MNGTLSKDVESVEDLLIKNKQSFRPTTYTEIELILRGIKSVGSIRREINKLIDLKVIRKIKVEVESTTFYMYAINKTYYNERYDKQFK